MNICPSDIEFMIHCHVQGFERHERYDAPAIQEAVIKFINNGLIKPYIIDGKNGKEGVKENCYETTDKGKAFIKMLCNTPFPVQEWLDPRDNKIVE